MAIKKGVSGERAINTIEPDQYNHILFFTGAGMSAESGIPTYRGKGGVWHQYDWENYACQAAFNRNPQQVLEFHQVRRGSILACNPHAGHQMIADLQKTHTQVTVVTQNIDGMHQRSGCSKVIELHGSIWRMRCPAHGAHHDLGESYRCLECRSCGARLRPDIVWFGDSLNPSVIEAAEEAISDADLFISVGTSGMVYPAAGFPQIAKENGAFCIEINPEKTELSGLYDMHVRQPAGTALPRLFSGK